MATDDSSPVIARRAVVIDDSEDQRDLLGAALRRGGFEIVGEAGDGLAGIELVRDRRPEVVLLDLVMPVLDGVEALPTIRALVPDATIVVLSGFGAQHMSARALALGADGYVQKGSSQSSILGRVRALCGRDEQPRERGLRLAPEPVSAAHPSALRSVPSSADRPRPGVPAQEVLRLAPFGVVEIGAGPWMRVLWLNEAARALLGPAPLGDPVSLSAPDLAWRLAYHAPDADPVFEVDLAGGRARARLRRTATSVLVYLDPVTASPEA